MARVDFKPIAGGEFVVPVDFSADGSTLMATGYFGSPYLTWTAQDGLTLIGGGCGAGEPSISPDGTTIVGCYTNPEGAGEAAIWQGGESWLGMGTEPGGVPCGSSLSSTYDNNGVTAVGLFWRAQICRAVGGTWDLASASAGPPLETIVPGSATRGNAITDDGSMIFGWQDDDFGSRLASRWIGGVHEYLTDGGTLLGEVLGTNSDGSVYWGANYGYDGTGRGWLYRNGQYEPMGVGAIGRNIQSPAIAASEDGSVVIGIYRDFDQFIQWGWIWTARKGFSRLDDYLKGQVPAGWRDIIGSAISPDGRFIAGYGINPDGAVQAFLIDFKATGKPQ
jgi:uncharacterized membrane protein